MPGAGGGAAAGGGGFPFPGMAGMGDPSQLMGNPAMQAMLNNPEVSRRRVPTRKGKKRWRKRGP